MRLTVAQQSALQNCVEYDGLYRSKTNLWNWYGRHPHGFTIKICGNPSVVKLLDHKLITSDGDHKVIATAKGRAMISAAPLPQKNREDAGT